MSLVVKPRSWWVAVAVSVLATASTVGAAEKAAEPVAAQPVAARTVVVPAHGSFRISLPAAWKYTTEPASPVDTDTQKSSPADTLQGETLRFDPAQGTRFTFQTTPAWVPPERRDAHEAATWMRVRLHGQTVEEDIQLQEFQGTRNKVYWFKATNKMPVPGQKSVLLQGATTVGELLVGFTLLAFPGELPEKDLVLQALGAAEHLQ